jgi:hypothetical protein
VLTSYYATMVPAFKNVLETYDLIRLNKASFHIS